MIKILFLFFITMTTLFSAEVKELKWKQGESFLTFLQKYGISQKFYFDLEKEDKELCSEINAEILYYLYENADGSLNQVLIPVSQEIQLHIFQDENKNYKFQTLPIDYYEFSETIALPINNSVAFDLQKATGDALLGAQLKAIFSENVNFRKMQKGDFISINYRLKTLMGRPFGMPVIDAAMVEVNGKQHFRFRNLDDDKYYDEKGNGFTKSYFFNIPLTYSRISSHFTKKRYHPVLKRYRAHLGTDFAAPRGRKIYAAADGRISFVGRKGGYGKTIIIKHANGYKTLYAHQNRFNSKIKRGKWVKKGQHIGYVGSTGLSSGPHLHLGLYKNGVAVNPLKIIKRPNTKSLKGAKKSAFVKSLKPLKDAIILEAKKDNPNKPTKLDRLTYKSDLAL
ncbi:MAG: peptidoglycan DD-metalloendopeptidase family protein [Sulfurovum sp.]